MTADPGRPFEQAHLVPYVAELDSHIHSLMRAMTVAEKPAGMSQIRVEPLVEQGRNGAVTHEVHLDLTGIDWRMLVGDFAARFLTLLSTPESPIIPLMMAAGARPCDFEQQAALTKLVNLLAGPTHQGSPHMLPPTWAMTPEAAIELATELEVAASPPVECACGTVVQQPTQLTNTCGPCVDRLGGNR